MIELRPMSGPAECRTCHHYQPGSPTAAAGSCRINAPTVLPESQGRAVWPLVMQIEWCGDYARKSVPVNHCRLPRQDGRSGLD